MPKIIDSVSFAPVPANTTVAAQLLPVQTHRPSDRNGPGSSVSPPLRQKVHPRVSQEFMELLKAFRPSGGLLRSTEVAARCGLRRETDVPTLTNWIAGRQVISFKWLSRTWLPLFQFSRPDMTRQLGLEVVLSELTEIYDDWEVAKWFARANPWLANCTPAEKLETDPAEVLQAARAERRQLAA